MATPLSATKILQGFRDFGVSYKTRAKWSTHTRTSAERPWGPVHGVMIHHTGRYSSEAAMLDLLWNGYAGLPGPLSLGGVTKAGVVHLTGYGRCNHAGGGDPRVLAAVIDEKTPYPRPRYADGEKGAVDGNPHFYGFEVINAGDGKDEYTEKQLDAVAAASAALCHAHGWTERSVIGHKQWQKGKPDPTYDMAAFQKRVRKHLDAHRSC